MGGVGVAAAMENITAIAVKEKIETRMMLRRF